jgi:hypothetical protein
MNQKLLGQEYTQYQLKIIQSLSYFTVTITNIEVDKGEKYQLSTVGKLKSFCFHFFICNTILKFVYLVLLVGGYFGQVDFLDKMCALLWILMCAEVTQELLFWASKFPLFEVK